MAYEVKAPLREISGNVSIGVNRSKSYPTSAPTLSSHPLAGKAFSEGSRASSRDKAVGRTKSKRTGEKRGRRSSTGHQLRNRPRSIT